MNKKNSHRVWYSGSGGPNAPEKVTDSMSGLTLRPLKSEVPRYPDKLEKFGLSWTCHKCQKNHPYWHPKKRYGQYPMSDLEKVWIDNLER